jgi:hypothetical protein
LQVIPLSGWDKIEKYFFDLVQNKLKKDYETLHYHKEFKFLADIGFVTYIGEPITEASYSYYILSLVDKNNEAALEFLSNSVNKLEIVKAICLQFYANDNVTKSQVENLLLLRGYNKDNFLFNTHSFLAFLDRCEILSYRKGKIKILDNPKAEMSCKPKTESKNIKTISITPNTPYTNVNNLRSIIRASKKYIWWFDKHFSVKGFEPLVSAVNGTSVKEIRILIGIYNVNKGLKNDYIRFKDERRLKG